MKLTTDGDYPYSSNEVRAFKALTTTKQSTTDLARKLYGSKNRMINPRGNVLSLMRSLQRKVDRNKEPFRIRHTDRAGPYPTRFWLEDR